MPRLVLNATVGFFVVFVVFVVVAVLPCCCCYCFVVVVVAVETMRNVLLGRVSTDDNNCDHSH